MRRVYTNWVSYNQDSPRTPRQIELLLDAERLVVEQREIAHAFDADPDVYTDEIAELPPPVRSESTFATGDEARAAFDAEVARLVPRQAIAAPDGEDPTLAWIGPAHGDEVLFRIDAQTTETDDAKAPVGNTDEEADVLADWQLAQADPHVRARGEFSNLQRHGTATDPRAQELLVRHADAWLSGLGGTVQFGFRGGNIDTIRLSAAGLDIDRLLRLPIAARTRRIVLEPGPLDPFIEERDSLLGKICRANPPALRELEILGGEVRTFDPIRQLAFIERLVIRGCRATDKWRIANETLRELHYERSSLFPELGCPALAKLTIRQDWAEDPDISRMLGENYNLKRLTLVLAERRLADLLRMFNKSWLERRGYEELVIGGSNYEDARAAIAQTAPVFAHLKHFAIEDSGVILPIDRYSARVIVLDPSGRVLLLPTRMPDGSDGRLWLAPGGALEDDESYEQAARRKLREETGLDLPIGPWIWTRGHTWYSAAKGKHCRATEFFHLVRTDRTEIDTSGPAESRWWTVEELAATSDVIAPRQLASLLPPLIAGQLPTTPTSVD